MTTRIRTLDCAGQCQTDPATRPYDPPSSAGEASACPSGGSSPLAAPLRSRAVLDPRQGRPYRSEASARRTPRFRSTDGRVPTPGSRQLDREDPRPDTCRPRIQRLRQGAVLAAQRGRSVCDSGTVRHPAREQSPPLRLGPSGSSGTGQRPSAGRDAAAGLSFTTSPAFDAAEVPTLLRSASITRFRLDSTCRLAISWAT